VKNDSGSFTLLVASADTTKPFAEHEIVAKSGDTIKLKVKYGDFSADLAKVNEALIEVFEAFSNQGLSHWLPFCDRRRNMLPMKIKAI